MTEIICYPFGNCHPKLVVLFPECYHVEIGIGYPDTFAQFKIFESQAIMHWHFGKKYYDEDEWEINLDPDNYILYFGRIVCEIANRVRIPEP